MNTQHAEICDEMLDDICVQYYHNKQIVVIISKHDKREHVDRFIDFIHDYFLNQPNGKELFLCFDLSQSTYSVYGVQRFMDLHKILGPQMQGRIAVVIKNDAIGQTMKLFAHFNLTKTVHERKFFYDRNIAIEWLHAGIPKSTK